VKVLWVVVFADCLEFLEAFSSKAGALAYIRRQQKRDTRRLTTMVVRLRP